MREAYTPPEPFDVQQVAVNDLHTLHVMQVGDPKGAPVVYLHGGPGGGVSLQSASFFDPERWRVILIDQRGAGQSTPAGSVEENTTWTLIDDLERVRERLGLERWHVFGGSWGSTLALAYAATHPERVQSLCLRGIFMGRPREIRWLYQHGASEIFPDAWEGFIAPIPEGERDDLVHAHHRRIFGDDPEAAARSARAWSLWEGSISRLHPNPAAAARFEADAFAMTFARIESHYFVNACFFDSPAWLLEQVDRFRHIPSIIVQGRYDVVCPARSAWDLHRAWPEAEFKLVHAGHSSFDDEIRTALLDATDAFAALPR